MKKTAKKLITVIFLIFGLSSLQAQETVSVAGGEAIGSGGSASYSVGQVFYTTHTGINGNYSAQGVQQAFEISVVLGIHEVHNINLSFSAYPNPVSDLLTLSVENLGSSTLTLELYDLNGKLLKSKKITGDITNIRTNNLVSATYFLRIMDNKKTIKSFKIIKNN